MKKGTFIVLDGNDGSGKATQAKMLVESLQKSGTDAIKVDFPAYDKNFFGAFTGECLAGQHGDFLHMDPKLASLPYALDRFESSKEICAALARGEVVIADRFTSANQIHQGGKIIDEKEREAFIAWLDKMEHEILGIPRPNLILYLRVPVEISVKLLQEKRARKNQHLAVGRDIVEEDRSYLERSHETADWLATQQSNWRIVDCASEEVVRSIEDIQSDIRNIVDALIRS